MKSKVSSSVSINFDYSIGNVIQREFLCNNNYKECLIRVLVHVLSCDGHSIVERHGKADTLIVSTVLDFACLGMDICLIAATTDSRYLWWCVFIFGTKLWDALQRILRLLKNMVYLKCGEKNRILRWSSLICYTHSCMWWMWQHFWHLWSTKVIFTKTNN